MEDPYRSCGIGSALMTKALAWLDENGSVRNRVSASDGNEGVWEFYKKFGFFPRLTVLEQSGTKELQRIILAHHPCP